MLAHFAICIVINFLSRYKEKQIRSRSPFAGIPVTQELCKNNVGQATGLPVGHFSRSNVISIRTVGGL